VNMTSILKRTNLSRADLEAIQRRAESTISGRAGWSGGASMAATATTDVPDWVGGVIEAAFYDRVGTPTLTLTRLAAVFNDLNGQPGQTLKIPTANATTPADNLAETVPATDDKLTSGAYTMTVKEGVKSIAWTDRTQVQSSQDPNEIAGQRVGSAMESRIELDLGAVLVAGRTIASDRAVAGKFTLADLRAMKRKIPARLRSNGLVLVAPVAVLDDLLDDPTVNNAATFGSDEAMRTGAFSRPLAGVDPYATDDGVLPTITASTDTVVLFARGMLAYGYQRNPRIETERDARARLTRHVGTMFHAEGTLEAAGIVAATVTGAGR
jgi:hypothetical protein